MNHRTLLSLALLAAPFTAVVAAPKSYDFEDPKGVNNVAFNLDAPLEAIRGTTNGVSGTITFDPAQPEKTTGAILIDATSLTVPNGTMQEHMLSEGWLDTATFDTIAFEARTLANIKTNGTTTTADVTGEFTLKGETREITVPVTFTYLEGKLAARTNGQMQGDLLVVRSTFKINRSDYGIKPGQVADKVAEEIEITLAIAGAAPSA